MRLILASSSPRRRELLATVAQDFEIIKPDIDESLHPGENPMDYVWRLCREKAETVIRGLTTPAVVLAADTIVLAADTIGVQANGALLGKPADVPEARTMLQRLRGRVHRVSTSIHVERIAHNQERRAYTERVITEVTMREYGDDEIDAYVATGDPFDKAGGYAIQHAGFSPVAHINGPRDNVVGLPLDAVRRGLHAVGYPLA